MGTLDNNGIYIYDENDRPAPLHTTLNLGQASTSASIADINRHSLIMPVANAAERDSYEQQMVGAGRPPSPEAPLYVDVADTGAVERNRGAGWERFVDNSLQIHVPNQTNAVWQRHNMLVKKNGYVTMSIAQKRIGPAFSGAIDILLSADVPPPFRPALRMRATGYIHIRNDYTRTFVATISETGGVSSTGYTVGQNNWLYLSAVWPTED